MAKQKAHGVGKEHTGCTYIFRFEMSEIIHNYAYIFVWLCYGAGEEIGGRTVSFYVREKGFSRKCF